MDRSMAVELTAQAPEQTRARYPDESGSVERDGVNPYWEVYGAGEPTVLLMPTWSIIHSRHWKMQIPYLARHCRVLTFDGPGNGRSDRPDEPDVPRGGVRRRRARGHGRDRHRARRARLARAERRRSASPRAGRSASEKLVFIAPALPLPPVMPRRRAAQEFEEPHDEHVKLGEVEPPLLGRELRGLPRVLLLAVLHGAALDEAA